MFNLSIYFEHDTYYDYVNAEFLDFDLFKSSFKTS